VEEEACHRIPVAHCSGAADAAALAEAIAARALVVEDRADTGKLLLVVLALAGYEARAAPDGLSGLHQALSWRPDAVVTDIGLPGLDGCWRWRSSA
jgi:DNA-binding response OmpR family regulator